MSCDKIKEILDDCFPRNHKFVTIYNDNTKEIACVTLQDILDAFDGQKVEIIEEFMEKARKRGKEKQEYYTPKDCDLYFANGTLCGYVAVMEAMNEIKQEMVGENNV